MGSALINLHDVYTILGVGLLAFVTGEVLKKLGYLNLAMVVDMVVYLIAAKVGWDAMAAGLRYISTMTWG